MRDLLAAIIRMLRAWKYRRAGWSTGFIWTYLRQAARDLPALPPAPPRLALPAGREPETDPEPPHADAAPGAEPTVRLPVLPGLQPSGAGGAPYPHVGATEDWSPLASRDAVDGHDGLSPDCAADKCAACWEDGCRHECHWDDATWERERNAADHRALIGVEDELTAGLAALWDVVAQTLGIDARERIACDAEAVTVRLGDTGQWDRGELDALLDAEEVTAR